MAGGDVPRDGQDYDLVTTQPPGESPAAATISPRSATVVGLASLVGAASSYVVLLVAARTLDKAENAEFLAFWSLLFWVFGVLAGVQNEATRAVSARERDAAPTGRADAAGGARVLPAGLLVGAGLALLLAATSPLWGARVLGDAWGWLVAVVAVAGLAYSGHSAVTGSLAGRRAWTPYASTVAAEPTARLVLVLVVLALGATTVGLQTASGAAAATWLLLVAASRHVRAGATARADVDRATFLRHVSHTLVAGTASAALVVGFTVLLRATSDPAAYATAAPFVLAISVTRAPLLVPLTAYQGVAISHFLAHRDAGVVRALWPSLRLVLGGGAAAALAVGLVGPWAMELLFGEGYRVPGGQLALLTAAAAGLAVLTLTGAAVLALGRHRAFATGWVLATTTSVVLLFVPLPLEARGILSLGVGPLVGIAAHAVALRGAPSAPTKV